MKALSQESLYASTQDMIGVTMGGRIS